MKQINVNGVIWTKEKVLEYLEKREDFLYKSIVLLFERQDDDEQVYSQTGRNNGRGFNKSDALRLSICAKLIKSGNVLYDHKLKDAKERMKKYANQILLIIEEKNK